MNEVLKAFRDLLAPVGFTMMICGAMFSVGCSVMIWAVFLGAILVLVRICWEEN